MKDRKFNNIQKPLEVPKRRAEDYEQYSGDVPAHHNMPEDERRRYRKQRSPKQHHQRKYEHFEAIAKQPNPELNMLLMEMIKNSENIDEKMQAEEEW